MIVCCLQEIQEGGDDPDQPPLDPLAVGRQPGFIYKTEWQRFRDQCLTKTMRFWTIRTFEPMMEIPLRILETQNFPVQKSFWIGPRQIADMLCFLAHFVVIRELLRKTAFTRRAQALDDYLRQYGNLQFARSFYLEEVLSAMKCTRMCNINNYFDRGSYRMRFLLFIRIFVSFVPFLCLLFF